MTSDESVPTGSIRKSRSEGVSLGNQIKLDRISSQSQLEAAFPERRRVPLSFKQKVMKGLVDMGFGLSAVGLVSLGFLTAIPVMTASFLKLTILLCGSGDSLEKEMMEFPLVNGWSKAFFDLEPKREYFDRLFERWSGQSLYQEVGESTHSQRALFPLTKQVSSTN